jgi:hypothetical protein
MTRVEDLGPIVVDPRAYESLWPALVVWLLLFVSAGDAWTVIRREGALLFGAPAHALIEDKRRLPAPLLGGARRDYLYLSFEAKGRRLRSREAVGSAGWTKIRVGASARVHVLGSSAFVDDDFGYSRWKLGLFGAAFAALWAWAAARRRFG